MKPRNKCFIFIILFAFAGTLGSTACRKQLTQSENTNQSTEQNPQSPKETKAETSFDNTALDLPHNYKGNDIAAVYDKAYRSISSVGKVSEEDGTRVGINSLYAFKMDNDFVDFSFSSVPGTLKRLNIRSFSVPDALRKERRKVRVIVVEISNKYISDYTGQNAFGATRKVTKMDLEEMSLAVSKVPRPMKINLKLRSEHFEETSKLAIGVLLICKLKVPFYSYGFEHKEPTFSDPYDVSRKYKILYADIKSIWVYETVTGKVLKKFAAG